MSFFQYEESSGSILGYINMLHPYARHLICIASADSLEQSVPIGSHLVKGVCTRTMISPKKTALSNEQETLSALLQSTQL